jgi:hypothetical protein
MSEENVEIVRHAHEAFNRPSPGGGSRPYCEYFGRRFRCVSGASSSP